MIIINVAQKSEAWYSIRNGKITASNADRLLTPAKRKTYAIDLLAEQKSEYIPEGFTSLAMSWGIENEDNAIAWYELETGNVVEKVGFCLHNDYDLIGCSPDGFSGSEGLIEIKCPNSKAHIEYRLEGIPKDYFAQVQFQMMVTGRKWCDFVSFDPRMPFYDRGYIERVHACEKTQSDLMNGALEVIKLINEYKEKIKCRDLLTKSCSLAPSAKTQNVAQAAASI